MTISEKLTAVAENQQEVYKAGQKSEYDRFWDEYQNKGERQNYIYAFGGQGWSDETFAPKYDLTPTYASYMFRESKITSLKARLSELGLSMDFSECMAFVYPFSASQIKDIGIIDTRQCSNLQYFLNNTTHLTEVERVIVRDDGTQIFGNESFKGCENLEQIRFEGIIGTNINFLWSPLSKDSIESVMAALSDYVVVKTVIFKKSAVDTAFETAEGLADGSTSDAWLELVATKENWTISLG